jgi:hypothetical protein
MALTIVHDIASGMLHSCSLSDMYAVISCVSFYEVYLFDAAEIGLFCVMSQIFL